MRSVGVEEALLLLLPPPPALLLLQLLLVVFGCLGGVGTAAVLCDAGKSVLAVAAESLSRIVSSILETHPIISTSPSSVTEVSLVRTEVAKPSSMWENPLRAATRQETAT